jgi:hypothetical protein
VLAVAHKYTLAMQLQYHASSETVVKKDTQRSKHAQRLTPDYMRHGECSGVLCFLTPCVGVLIWHKVAKSGNFNIMPRQKLWSKKTRNVPNMPKDFI